LKVISNLRSLLTLILLLSVCLIFGQSEVDFLSEEDTLFIDGFAIDKAFLQELRDVIGYDSTDFLISELNYYNDILKNESRLTELQDQSDSLLHAYTISYEIDDYEQALLYYRKYLNYKDSINAIINARNVTDLNEQYKTVEKQRNIELLDQENKLKALELDKGKQLRWIMYTASVFLLLFLIISLNFFRLKILKKRYLNREVKARRIAEEKLWQIKKELESIVKQRKNELIAVNLDLEDEIIEIEELNRRLIKAERLKIVGEMASGMLDVIENPVRSIYLAVRKFKEKFYNGEPEINEMSDILIHTSSKVKKTLHRLSQFSLADKSNLKLEDLNEIVINTVNLFKFKKLEKQIRFETRLSSRVSLVKLDKVKMEGILINLILNSIDSISEKGVITITSRNSSNNVVVVVSDTGSGIGKEEQNNVFNPFFTTKEKGIGLGLSIVHQYVLSMNGTISFSSKSGVGTRIRITLPAGDSDA